MITTHWRFAHTNETLAAGRVVFYDCEFVREYSYYPKLALMQWLSAGDDCAVLADVLSTNPPWHSLVNHDAPIVVHSGRQDLELILQESGQLPRSIRDTQIGFALCSPTMMVGLADLVFHFTALDVDKSETRSDWLARPLSEAQLRYAANDVGLLSKVYAPLCAELAALGRLSWWAEECAFLLQHTTIQQAQPWYKLHLAPQLRGRETAVAKVLHDVRELVAAELNQPRRKVLSDELIVTMARSEIVSCADIAEYLPPEHPLFSQLALLEEQLTTIVAPYPKIPRAPRLTMATRKKYEHFLARRAEVADALNIHPDMLVSQRQLRAFIANAPNTARLTSGWRMPFFDDLN